MWSFFNSRSLPYFLSGVRACFLVATATAESRPIPPVFLTHLPLIDWLLNTIGSGLSRPKYYARGTVKREAAYV
jgi:hypothetical protein